MKEEKRLNNELEKIIDEIIDGKENNWLKAVLKINDVLEIKLKKNDFYTYYHLMYKRVFKPVNELIITREDKFHKYYSYLNIDTALVNRIDTDKYIVYSILDVIEESVYVIVIIRANYVKL